MTPRAVGRYTVGSIVIFDSHDNTGQDFLSVRFQRVTIYADDREPVVEKIYEKVLKAGDI